MLALAAIAILGPAAIAAHPLGNFTINHYAGLRISSEEVALDIVIDQAEIPAFGERRRLDANGDGDVSEAEAAAARAEECASLARSLTLTIDGATVGPRLEAAGLSFPPGAGGVPTMRLVCEYVAPVPGGVAHETTVAFADASYAERLGWREIVVRGDGVTIGPAAGSPIPPTSDASARLTAYPADLLSQPLDIRAAAVVVTPGGPSLAPFVAPDAAPLDSLPLPGGTPAPGEVPGGVGGEIPDIFVAAELTPIVIVASILVAAGLGAGHALTPGHGKTLVAAYLVGTRGTVRHALLLGLSVTVSHTLGILALALLVTGAESILPPDAVVRTVPLLAALGFVAIGAWMVGSEVRRRMAVRSLALAHARAHADGHDHGHDHGHDPHPPEPEHSHGGVRHTHVTPAGATITWRSLFALGLAGGIIPSTNALIILLGALVAGRAAFGVVLVIAFGIGMALVLGGLGVGLVLVRGRLDRLPSTSALGRLTTAAPLVASVVVLGVGLWLTAQAIGGLPTG